VHDGIGEPLGTSSPTHIKVYGIYLDDNSSGVEVAYNTVFNNPSWGIHLHNNKHLNVHHNTAYNNTGEASELAYAQAIFNDDNIHNTKMYDITFKHNILVSRTSIQKALYLASQTTAAGPVATMGAIDSNYYARPINDSMVLTSRNLGGGVTSHSRTSWKAAFTYDDYSPYSPVTFTDVDSTDYYIVFIYNPTNADSTVDLIDGASYTTVTGDDYSESVELAPYTGLVLLRTPDPPDPPAPTPDPWWRYKNKIFRKGNKSMTL
jgi:parallel beta-helix repeat protein